MSVSCRQQIEDCEREISRLKDLVKKKEENEKKYQGLIESWPIESCVHCVFVTCRVTGTVEWYCRAARKRTDCTEGIYSRTSDNGHSE